MDESRDNRTEEMVLKNVSAMAYAGESLAFDMNELLTHEQLQLAQIR